MFVYRLYAFYQAGVSAAFAASVRTILAVGIIIPMAYAFGLVMERFNGRSLPITATHALVGLALLVWAICAPAPDRSRRRRTAPQEKRLQAAILFGASSLGVGIFWLAMTPIGGVLALTGAMLAVVLGLA